jgi:hypothetical protein
MSLEEALPLFASELEEALNRQGSARLAKQVRQLPLIDRCRCGDDFCATFYTAPKPSGAYGAGHKNVIVDSERGMIILDVVKGKICCVEVLFRKDVQQALFAVLP